MNTSTPCVRSCCLDYDDVCLGCCRTLEEIKAWSKMSEQERASLMKELPMRKRLREEAQKRNRPLAS